MSLIPALAFMLAQAPGVIGTVPTPNAELDAAYACLIKGTERLLAERRPAPDEQARWGWAVEVAAGCEPEIKVAAESKGSIAILGDYAHSSISKRDMLRAEAGYFVDRLIREHYEATA
ncbi:MAG: hypothetical protein EDM03_16125 [Porphyrobacter sp. IPPAS B-1204]|nr:MAG: hypothetical protein EDM03_16125 [Porphyrobacter sp. IPPAS B-1204]